MILKIRTGDLPRLRQGYAGRGPGFANRLRPRADFDGSRGYAGRGRRVEFVTTLSPLMVRSASSRVSNHEGPDLTAAILRDARRRAPQDEVGVCGAAPWRIFRPNRSS